MKCSLGISHILEEIASLSHPVVFLYLLALFTEEGFLISLRYSLELCIQMGIPLLPLASLLFSVLCKASSGNHFAFLHFFFLGMVLVTASCTMPWASTCQPLYFSMWVKQTRKENSKDRWCFTPAMLCSLRSTISWVTQNQVMHCNKDRREERVRGWGTPAQVRVLKNERRHGIWDRQEKENSSNSTSSPPSPECWSIIQDLSAPYTLSVFILQRDL